MAEETVTDVTQYANNVGSIISDADFRNLASNPDQDNDLEFGYRYDSIAEGFDDYINQEFNDPANRYRASAENYDNAEKQAGFVYDDAVLKSPRRKVTRDNALKMVKAVKAKGKGTDGYPASIRFPDGTIYYRDLTHFSGNNGYHPAVFEKDGTVRLVTSVDLAYLEALRPDQDYSDIVYRKDYLEEYDRIKKVKRDRYGIAEPEKGRSKNYMLSEADLRFKRKSEYDAYADEVLARSDSNTNYSLSAQVFEDLRADRKYSGTGYDNDFLVTRDVGLDEEASNRVLASDYKVMLMGMNYDSLPEVYKQQATREEYLRQIVSVDLKAADDALFWAAINQGGSLKMAKQEYFASAKMMRAMGFMHNYLSAEVQAKWTKDELYNGTAKVGYYEAKDALNGASLRKAVAPYVTKEELAKMTDRDCAEKVNECYDKVDLSAKPMVFEGGRINLYQQAELTAHGVAWDKSMSYDEAKKYTQSFEPTLKQLDMVKAWMPEEQAAKMNRGEMSAAIDSHIAEYKERMQQPVERDVYKYAVSQGLVKRGQEYTNGQWAKDSEKVPPMPAQAALIRKNCLEHDIKWYQENVDKFKGKEISHALVASVNNRYARKCEEMANAPCSDGQKKFFEGYGIELDPKTSWMDAQKALCEYAYKERLLGKADAKYIHNHEVPGLNKKILAQLQNTDKNAKMTDEQRSAVRATVHELCNKQRMLDRQYAIDTAPVVFDRNSVRSVALDECYKYQKEHGSLEGVEKHLADKLVREDFKPTEQMVAQDVTVDSVISSTITTVVPGCVEYGPSLEKNTALVKDARAAYAAEKAQELSKGNTGRDGNEGRG